MTDENPLVKLDFRVMWCPRHLDPLRPSWPAYAIFAMIGLFNVVVRDERVIDACAGDANHLGGVLQSFSPVCCFVGQSKVDEIIGMATRRLVWGHFGGESEARMDIRDWFTKEEGEYVCLKCGDHMGKWDLEQHVKEKHPGEEFDKAADTAGEENAEVPDGDASTKERPAEGGDWASSVADAVQVGDGDGEDDQEMSGSETGTSSSTATSYES